MRRATQDFTTGTFFNRVIDDSKASDNTRHLSRHPVTGEPFLRPPAGIRRVLLVSGAVRDTTLTQQFLKLHSVGQI